MEELRCPHCDTLLSEDMIDSKMCFECGESFEDIILNAHNLSALKEQIQKQLQEDKQRIEKIQYNNKELEEKQLHEKERQLLEEKKRLEESERLAIQKNKERLNRIQNATNILVTTGDLKQNYEVIGPVYFQISNKGLFSSTYSKLAQQYMYKIQMMQQDGTLSKRKRDWGFLYGEWSVGQNDFEKAFYIATEELKKRAAILEADAIICMRQDIDLDTNGFAYFYLQMYGTAVRYLEVEEIKK